MLSVKSLAVAVGSMLVSTCSLVVDFRLDALNGSTIRPIPDGSLKMGILPNRYKTELRHKINIPPKCHLGMCFST